MKINKYNLIVIIVVIVALVGYFLTIGNISKPSETVKIGMSQTISHVVFENDIVGIKEVLEENGYEEGKNLMIEVQNGQGDVNILQAIAQKFSKGDYTIFVSLGTSASQAMANQIKDKPIVFTAVTDPELAKLVKSKQNPSGNVTGATDATNYNLQLELFKRVVPNLRRIGVVYNPGEVNSVSAVKDLKKVGQEMGLEILTIPVNNANDVLYATQSLASKVDGFFSIGDNTVLAAETVLIKTANERKKPVFTIVSDGVKKGGLMSIGADYKKLGRKTGVIILQIIKGEKPENIPVVGFSDADVDVYLNQKTADLLGIKFSDELVKQAKEIYR